MSESRTNSNSQAIGFWKFVILTTFLIVVARGGPGYFGNVFSTFPVSAFLWILYRSARTQAWWPMNSNVSLASRFEAMANQLKDHQLKENQLNAESLRKMANASLGSQRVKAKSKFVAKVSQAKDRITIDRINVDRASDDRLNEPASFKMLGQMVSSVGTRSKTIRHKTSRKKAIRSKRPPGFL